jgi:hypothetical protein
MTAAAPSQLTANIGKVGGATYKSDTVTLGVNRRPVVTNKAATVVQLNWTNVIDLKSGATDADGDALVQAKIESAPANGKIIKVSDTEVRWVPVEDFVGTDTFTYSVFDGHQWSIPATVTVTVTEDATIVNPVAAIGTFKLGTTVPPKDAETDPGAIGVLAQVADPAAGHNTQAETQASLDFKADVELFLAAPLLVQNGALLFGQCVWRRTGGGHFRGS